MATIKSLTSDELYSDGKVSSIVDTAAFDDDGNLVFSASNDESVSFNTGPLKEYQTTNSVKKILSGAYLDPTEIVIPRPFEIQGNYLNKTLLQNVLGGYFSPDGQFLLTASVDDQRVRSYRLLRTGPYFVSQTPSAYTYRSVAWAPESNGFAAVDSMGYMTFYKVLSDGVIVPVVGSHGSPYSFAEVVWGNNNLLYVQKNSPSGTVEIWDVSDWENENVFFIKDAIVAPSGTWHKMKLSSEKTHILLEYTDSSLFALAKLEEDSIIPFATYYSGKFPNWSPTKNQLLSLTDEDELQFQNVVNLSAPSEKSYQKLSVEDVMAFWADGNSVISYGEVRNNLYHNSLNPFGYTYGEEKSVGVAFPIEDPLRDGFRISPCGRFFSMITDGFKLHVFVSMGS